MASFITSLDSFLKAGVRAMVVLAYAAMVAIGALQVLGRYLFKSSFVWTDESIRFIYVWSVLLTAALIFAEGRHIRVDLLHGWYPAPLRRAVDLVSNLLVIVFILALGIFGTQFVQVANVTAARSTALELPMALVYSAFPISAFLMLWFHLGHMWRSRLVSQKHHP
jgi:C4-dicarboxylate transporter DctQ subunit